jgi:hypothetical protein
MIKIANIILGILLGFAMIHAGPVEDLNPGHWYAVPNSHLRSVSPNPIAFPGIQAGMGIRGVIGAWSGGTYDTKRDRLVIWGGGHWAYGGNEIYVFDVPTLQWIRYTEPFPNPVQYSHKNSDGTPPSRHTYGGILYITHADRLFGLGGSPYGQAGMCGTNLLWTFDIANKTWHDMAPSGAAIHTECENKSVYWEENGKIYYGTCQSGWRGWYAYDYDANIYNIAGPITTSESGCVSGGTYAIDPQRKLIVGVGNSSSHEIEVLDLQGADLRVVLHATTGDNVIAEKSNPGFVYDPVSDKMIAWYGGNDVYSLNTETWEWTRHAPAPANTVNAPAVTASGGVYGRFQYVPSRNVFIVVNHVDEDVYIYRLTSGTEREKAVFIQETAEMTATPNPFYSGTHIRISNIKYRMKDYEIQICDINGKMVSGLTADNQTLKDGIQWRPGNIPAGIYVIKLKLGKTFKSFKLVHCR